MRFMGFLTVLRSKTQKWANDARSNAVRTWGIAGELLTAREPTEGSVSQLGSGRRRVDGVSRGPTGVCYKKRSSLRPPYNGCRLIYAIKQGQKAPQACKNQTQQYCHWWATCERTWSRLDPHAAFCSRCCS